MTRLLSTAALTGTLIASSAFAATVNVDFDGGETHNLRGILVPEGDGYNRRLSTLIWQENGVNTFVRTQNNLLDYFEPEEIAPWAWQGLNDDDTGFDFNSMSMTISRADGGTFNVKRIGTNETYEGRAVESIFVPEGGDEYRDQIRTVYPLLGPSVFITAKRSDGSTVSGYGVTKTLENYDFDPDWQFAFGPMDVLFPPGLKASLTNLKEITLSAAATYLTPSLENAAGIATMLAFGAPQELLDGLEYCGGFNRSCEVPGVGRFANYASIYGGRNDAIRVEISDFDLEFVGGHGTHPPQHTTPHPAPVPLPASALFLLGGLATLTAMRGFWKG